MSLQVKLLDRYIANEFWQPLLFGIGIVTGVWFGADQLKTIFNLIMRSGVEHAAKNDRFPNREWALLILFTHQKWSIFKV